ncbi:hypothetical protein TRM7557_03857 [Tritonibacter multivorans]|uniref:Uncharacterized protein n=1 Tax=Tritonibacter multivorans TaxID=928856 RepID=A0A0N7M152_9RHOB|nr:hypothetical protein [Tritonibacter multivorans]MDA7421497.1 hypothetical protein [Tritonibacter multivorans]CUH82297.1 hypothetical protein TRM7557_03857 [Tritonibacter multivorans]SFC97869.1 hypothetical protein SAMN04488049_105203 [Tritonibacter multivorans]
MGKFTVVCAAILAVAAAPLMFLAVAGGVSEPGVALIVARPGLSPETIIAAAGLAEIGPERAPFGAFAQIDTLDDVKKLQQAGAVFVLDGRKVLELCS